MIESYLKAVDSVVERLFEARVEYETTLNDLFRLSIGPIFTFNRNNSEEVIENDHAKWSQSTHISQEKEIASLALEELGDELFALSVIDGSLLQIACKGIDLYSINTINSSPIDDLSINLCKFSVGTKIDGMPSGLIVYAGRNHYNHLEDGSKLRKPSKQIVDYLDEKVANFEFYLEPYSGLPGVSTASFIKILGWNNIEDFKKTLLSINEI